MTKWISFKEQIPPLDKPVLAWRVGEHWAEGKSCYAIIHWSNDRGWVDYWDGDRAELMPPKYWMPLPEKPETDKNEVL